MTPAAEHARIFGAKPEPTPGRSRMCKTCGDWHALDRPWPHNCRPPSPPRSNLAAPRIAPKFTEFLTGPHDAPVVINDRRDKRNHMDRHDLAEYDAGIQRDPGPSERQWLDEFAQDFKRQVETDPLNRPPVEVIGQADTADAGDIDTSDIEVFK